MNPSPNIPNLNSVRAYCGTVLLEGTTFSEGRGTTRALEVAGAPDIDARRVLQEMNATEDSWMQGALIRECFFEPTVYKHQGRLCNGLQFHTDTNGYNPQIFKPYRLMALFFKCVRHLYPDYEMWRNFHYEYVKDRLAIDVINGSSLLREWVEDPSAKPDDFEKLLKADEIAWQQARRPFLIYAE